MTWSCPKCGKAYFSEEEMKRCNCKPSQKCPDCNGIGKKVKVFGQAVDCPHCNGSGKLYY